MPKQVLPLSETQIEETGPSSKQVRLFDGKGLFLQIEPSGKKLWRYKYRFDGKQKMISFGSYPQVSLSEARVHRHEAQMLLKEGNDPSEFNRQEKETKRIEAVHQHGKPSVRITIDGTFELWKGRSVLYLTREEMQFINNLVSKLV